MSGVTYSAFVDPGGGNSDSMTLAIGHRQDDVIVIDVVRERRPPFSPEDVVLEFSAILNSYQISSVTGDRYGGEWPRGEIPRTRDCLRGGGEAKVGPLPRPSARHQFAKGRSARRRAIVCPDRWPRASHSTRWPRQHRPRTGAHDDVANAAAGVVAALASSNYEYESMDWVNGPDRRKPSASGGDNRWAGDVRPSLHNISLTRSIDLDFQPSQQPRFACSFDVTRI